MSPVTLLSIPVLLLFIAALVCGQQSCSDKSQVITLKKNLLCGYDKSTRPVKKHTDKINVYLQLHIKNFNFEEYKSTLRLNTWTYWRWNDDLLTWDPKAYGGLTEIRLESDSIWVPDIIMHSTGEYTGAHHRMPSTSCVLRYVGEIICVPPTSYAALCSPDLTKWPFDVQQCLAEMASWTHSGNEIALSEQDRWVSWVNGVRGWNLETAKGRRQVFHYSNNDSYQYLQFGFLLRRHSASYAATVVTPALVLALMTLLMFFLDPISPQRLNLGCMNVLAHCLYLQYLGMKLPSNGASTPLIVIFFRDSLFLVGMSLFTTIILRGMLTAERAPPAWISSIITWILESRPGQLLILSQLNPRGAAAASADDGAVLMDSTTDKPKNNLWGFTAVLLDRVCLVVFTVTLFIMLLAFVP
ncbi:neuronal acetylcholine receptor subunit non-alpha-2 [Anabrus simplex]|uniref:neuronal acetylcholine receptor subunit non-alpha-2 n=1 Tax=Anabrus simplex TaxID=316456 RepID=UPI0035A32414